MVGKERQKELAVTKALGALEQGNQLSAIRYQPASLGSYQAPPKRFAPASAGLERSAISYPLSANKFRRAFTLIEILAAMAVLAILLLICANVFSSATRAWNGAAMRTQQNAQVRGALDRLAMDIGQAYISTNLWFYAQSRAPYNTADQVTTYGEPAYSLHFCTMNGYALSYGSCDEVSCLYYFVRQEGAGTPTNSYVLYWQDSEWNANSRSQQRMNPKGNNTPMNVPHAYEGVALYQAANWLKRMEMDAQTGLTNKYLLRNISTFKVMAGQINGGQMTVNDVDFKSNTATPANILPPFFDVYIGVLSDEDQHKANLMSPGTAQNNFVRLYEKRFVERIYCIYRPTMPPPNPHF